MFQLFLILFKTNTLHSYICNTLKPRIIAKINAALAISVFIVCKPRCTSVNEIFITGTDKITSIQQISLCECCHEAWDHVFKDKCL